MKNIITIGAELDAESVQNVTNFVTAVFKVGYECRMEQDTIMSALTVLGSVCSVDGTTIKDCTLSGDKVYNMENTDDTN